jgi:hypothetical protein
MKPATELQCSRAIAPFARSASTSTWSGTVTARRSPRSLSTRYATAVRVRAMTAFAEPTQREMLSYQMPIDMMFMPE